MKPLFATPYAPLSPLQRWGVVLLFAIVFGFGGIVEMRSAFLHRRMTDLDTYLRAAWAVRTGGNPYAISDDAGLHYYYPPLLAILLVPLADPPPGVDRSGMLPFPASVAIWYLVNVLCLGVAAHCLANALEQTSEDPRVRTLPRGCQRWWALRVLPVLVCLIPIGHTFARSQVNVVILALLCAMIAAFLRDRRFTAGLYLSGAICIKVMPVFVVLYPMWRRDRRALAGCAAGVVFGLAVIPVAALGPTRVVGLAETWVQIALRPAFAEGGDRSRDRELLRVSDNQSLVMVLHNLSYAHLAFADRPARPSVAARCAHAVLACAVIAVTLAVGRRRRFGSAAEVVFIGLLIVTMLLVSPVCHLHYFALVLPLVMELVALGFDGQSGIGVRRAFRWVAVTYPIASTLPQLPGLQVLKHDGLAMAATLALWVVGTVTLWTLEPVLSDVEPRPGAPQAAALPRHP